MIRYALMLLAAMLATPAPADPASEIADTLAQAPTSLKGASEFTCMAVTLYHEARGEDRDGMIAVASVILTRVMTPDRWGSTICDVVEPSQFTYYLDGPSLRTPPIEEYDAWMMAQEVATVIMVEGPDPWLMGADHYHTIDINPYWNRGMTHVETMQRHIFWRDPDAEKRRG